MCGIAGIVSHEPLRPDERAALRPMLASLRHRGPDGAAIHHHPRAALGHCRLGILDLPGGSQPIRNERGDVWAVANAEIYNYRILRGDLAARGHRLAGAGDCETLVHLYEEHGEGAIDFLNGMFAFALWDERTATAILARDRLGEKPLYYHFDGRRLAFASELKALLQLPGVSRELDAMALLDYLVFGFIPAPKTIYRAICKLPAGCSLRLANGRLSMRRYWDLRFRAYSREPMGQIAECLWQRLREATRLRMDCDVPFGAFLSGGLDSAAVVAAMARLSGESPETLTCGFQPAGFDERDAARQAAEILGTRHQHTLAAEPCSEMVDRLLGCFDEPLADASAIPMYLLSREARRRKRVMLSGDGGDELLAGYRRYRFDCHEDRLRRRLPRSLRSHVLPRLAAAWPQRSWIPRPLRAGATLRNLSVDAATAHALSIATLAPQIARDMLQPDVADELEEYDPLEQVRQLYAQCDAPDHLSKCQYVDIKFGLADGILTKVDRSSMAHGLEVRAPLLDYRLAEFAWTIPPALRLNRTTGKLPLRTALQRQGLAPLAGRTKRGFEVPLDDWLLGPLRERIEDRLLAPGAAALGVIHSRTARRMWQDHAAGRRRLGANLWKLLMLDAWCEGQRHAGHEAPAIEADGSVPCLHS